jgi:hypothetical protein
MRQGSVAIDWEAISKEKELEKKAESIRRDKRAKEIILHPVSIIVQILNIIMIYGFYEKFTPYSGLKIALTFAFLQLLFLSYIYLHKPDEEA